MKKRNGSSLPEADEQRRRAEARLTEEKRAAPDNPSQAVDIRQLVHELEVHQVELEMQNEELVQSRLEAETLRDQYTDLYDFAPVGYLSLDNEGYIQQANLAGAALLGRPRSELLRQRFRQFVAFEHQPMFDRLVGALLADHDKHSCELVLNPAGLPTRWVQIEAVGPAAEGIPAPGPRSAALRMTITDISRLKEAEFGLSQLNRQLEERVAERTEELERASKTKDEFLAAMSHELRSPLNGVLMLAESLANETYGPLNPRQKRALESMATAGQHLLSLINDVLDFSKGLAGKLALHPSLVDIAQACQTSLTIVAQAAARKQIDVDFRSDGVVNTLVADKLRLVQILVNLLTNAVKFTPEGGHVVLEVTGDIPVGRVRFCVADTGIGIAAGDLDRLFRPFVQLDSRLNRKYEGSGLGLALVQQLVELHGGIVAVESRPGQGSRFTVTLPLNEFEEYTVAGE